jgi:hypothetical protein
MLISILQSPWIVLILVFDFALCSRVHIRSLQPDDTILLMPRSSEPVLIIGGCIEFLCGVQDIRFAYGVGHHTA